MMKNETCPTDAGKLRSGTPRQQRRGLWSLATLTGLVLVAISGPVVWAKVSNTTGPINGRAPTATGTLNIAAPGGTVLGSTGITVEATTKPSQFVLAALTSGLAVADADGDTGLSITAIPANIAWTWTRGGVVLTTTQLTQPLGVSQTLAVTASALVTTSSLTGAPISDTQTFTSDTYTVRTLNNPVVRVNGSSFAIDGGFPTTGFVGATFQFWMDGTSINTNANYRFTSDQPWANVGLTTGAVTFTNTPSTGGNTFNIRIVDTTGANAPRNFTATVTSWYNQTGIVFQTYAAAFSGCAAQSSRIPSYYEIAWWTAPNYAGSSSGWNTAGGLVRYPTGGLWNQWGYTASVNYPGIPGYAYGRNGYFVQSAPGAVIFYADFGGMGFTNLQYSTEQAGQAATMCVRTLI